MGHASSLSLGQRSQVSRREIRFLKENLVFEQLKTLSSLYSRTKDVGLEKTSKNPNLDYVAEVGRKAAGQGYRF